MLLLGIGGALGSLARFKVGAIVAKYLKSKIPMGTFSINITGAILLGIVSGIKVQGNMYLLMADGFLGAFTTFSTFMFEGISLYGNKKSTGFYYILITFVFGILGYIFGLLIGSSL